MYFESVLSQSRIPHISITRIQETFSSEYRISKYPPKIPKSRSRIGEKGLILRRNGFQNGPGYASYEDGIRGGFIIIVLKQVSKTKLLMA